VQEFASVKGNYISVAEANEVHLVNKVYAYRVQYYMVHGASDSQHIIINTNRMNNATNLIT
jgi:hypothetical protein